MKISDCMSRDVGLASPTMTIRDAARMMAETDAGSVPVGQDDRLVGMLTDRDIAIGAVGAGKSPSTPVAEVMSQDLKSCFEDDDVESVARNMAQIQVRRLPVLSRAKRLVGIVSMGDLASRCPDRQLVGDAVKGVSRNSAQHNQVRAG